MATGQEIYKEQGKIDELIDFAWQQWDEGKHKECEKSLKKAWDLYPDPKEKWSEAYNTAKSIFHYYFDENLSEAKIWLNQMIKDNNINHNFDGDLEFEIGTYKYELGLYEEALEYFMISTTGSAGMRYFGEADKKYREFYKNPEKIKQGLVRGKNTKRIKEKNDFV
jgi:tetratricopeptide (TPR) repeat protein